MNASGPIAPRAQATLIEGVSPSSAEVEFLFEGSRLLAYEGEALASALLRQGVSALRETAAGEPRGYYCGMGVCWECAVHVEAVGVVRACAHPVRPGLVAHRADGPNA